MDHEKALIYAQKKIDEIEIIDGERRPLPVGLGGWGNVVAHEYLFAKAYVELKAKIDDKPDANPDRKPAEFGGISLLSILNSSAPEVRLGQEKEAIVDCINGLRVLAVEVNALKHR